MKKNIFIIIFIMSAIILMPNVSAYGAEYHEVRTADEDGTTIYVMLEVDVDVTDIELEIAVRNSVDNFTVFELFDEKQSDASITKLMDSILIELRVIDADIVHILIRYNDKEIERPIMVEEDESSGSFWCFFIGVIVFLFVSWLVASCLD